MARRQTISDVARAAGVSVATVDRVLNGRQKVREETKQTVYHAAQSIGYHAAGLIGQKLLVDLPEITFGFILHKEKQDFYKSLAFEIEKAVRQCTTIRGRAIIEYSPSQAPADFAELIRGMEGRVDAVAATAVTHHHVTDAVVQLKEAGVPTFALLNDYAQGIRQSYVGLNNIKIGRLAGWMIATAVSKPGKAAIFVGGHRWHGHELRETGFRSYFREFSPDLTVMDTLVNLETRQLTYEATLDLLSRHRDLQGIYVGGGGMEGAIAALREVREPGEVALVVNEFTKESRAALSDRYVTMVIATPLEILCRDLVDLMVASVQSNLSGLSGQHFLQPEIVLAESL